MNITDAGVKILEDRGKDGKIPIDEFGRRVTRVAMGRVYSSYKIKDAMSRIISAYENKHHVTDENTCDDLNGIVIKYYGKSSEKRGKTLTAIKVFQEGDEDDLYEYLRNRKNKTKNQVLKFKSYINHVETNKLLPINKIEPLMLISTQ